MPYYKTCPYCGAALDPGERCDCEKEAAPEAANIRDGNSESEVTSPTFACIVSADGEVCQE